MEINKKTALFNIIYFEARNSMIQAPCKSSSQSSSVLSGTIVVKNDRGLHTRPCTEIVKCASSFKSEVRLVYHGYTVNAKSLLGILMLAAPKGAKIKLEVVGKDAKEAIEALLSLAHNNFYMKY